MSKPTCQFIDVFIADDHALFRKDLKALVALNKDFHLAGEAEDGETAWKEIQSLKPNIVLLDISMPGMNGLEVAARIRKSNLPVKIILVSAYKSESFIKGAMDIEVEGYVLKDDTIKDLPKALWNVSNGQRFISPGLESLIRPQTPQSTQTPFPDACLDLLTPRELRVLRLMADRESDTSIGKQLSLTPDSVAMLKTVINLKFDFTTDQELQNFALHRKEELKSFKLLPQDYSKG